MTTRSARTTTPFDRAPASIPVTVVTTGNAENYVQPGAALLRLEPALHEHEAGSECVACAARGDIRALLFDMLTRMRTGERQQFDEVVVDASALRDPKAVAARLQTGVLPAFGLRDHTVARSFHLSRLI